MNLIAVAGFIFFLDESPIYLYSKGEIEKADKIVEKICKINNMFRQAKAEVIPKEAQTSLLEI